MSAFPFQTPQEEKNIRRYLDEGFKNIVAYLNPKFSSNSEKADHRKNADTLNIKIKNMTQLYPCLMKVNKTQPLASLYVSAKEAEKISSPDFYIKLGQDGYSPAHFLSETMAHFVGRVPFPVMEQFFTPLVLYVQSTSLQTAQALITFFDLPFQAPQNATEYCASVNQRPVEEFIQRYRATPPNGSSLYLFFENTAILFDYCFDHSCSPSETQLIRTELIRSVSDLLQKGWLARPETAAQQHLIDYRLQAYLYLGGVNAFHGQWSLAAKHYKNALQELHKPHLPAHFKDRHPSFDHNLHASHAFKKVGHSQDADHVLNRRPFST
jgi:hypothetical protein